MRPILACAGFALLLTVISGCSSDDDSAAAPTAVPPTSTPAPATSTAVPATPTQTAAPSATATHTAGPPTETATPAATPTATVDPAILAADGEAAFFDTLYGTRNREEEAIALLGAAIAGNPSDGRSHFLLGMMHLFRAGQALTDYTNPSAFVLEEVARAQVALDAAVPLSGADPRVPGFRGAATFLNAVVNDDDELRALGLQQLRDAIVLYPDFNNFSFLGAVAPAVPADDPLFLEALELVRLAIASGCGPLNEPEICGNEGKAPHNVQGAFLMFGDMYAKAGNATQALVYYRFGLQLPGKDTWPFRAAMEERIATVQDRVARWSDEDPSNDPPFAGKGSEACAICHYK